MKFFSILALASTVSAQGIALPVEYPDDCAQGESCGSNLCCSFTSTNVQGDVNELKRCTTST